MKKVVFLLLATVLIISLVVSACTTSVSTPTVTTSVATSAPPATTSAPPATTSAPPATTSAPPATTSAPPTQPKTIKIGALVTLSGPGSETFSIQAEGMTLCEKWINDNGGITINGEKYLIELIIEDDKMSPDGAIAATNKLVNQDQVSFMLGPLVSFLAQATATITEPAKVLRLLINPIIMPDMVGVQCPYTFATTDTNALSGVAYDYLLEAYPEVKTVAMLCPEEPGALFHVESCKKVAEDHGIQTVFQEPFPFGTTDFYSLWTRIIPTNPDAVSMAGMTAASAGSLMKQGRELGFEGVFFDTMYIGYPQICLDLAGKDCTDFFSMDPYVESPEMTPMIKQIAKMESDEYGKAAIADHIFGFETVWDMVQAIEEAQSLDSTEVMKSFEAMTSIETPMGTGTMGGMSTLGVNHVVVHPEPIFAIMNGTMKHVKWVMPDVP